MIQDREIRFGLTQFLAAFFWGATISCLIGAAFVYELEPFGIDRYHAFLLCAIGLGFSAAAATMSIRSYLCVFSSRIQDAFELGRETAKYKGEQVRNLR